MLYSLRSDGARSCLDKLTPTHESARMSEEVINAIRDAHKAMSFAVTGL